MAKHISVRIPDHLEEAMNKFCEEEGRTKSWLIQRAIQEKLEDWEDLREGLLALREHHKNPQTITHQKLVEELGLEIEDLSSSYVPNQI